VWWREDEEGERKGGESGRRWNEAAIRGVISTFRIGNNQNYPEKPFHANDLNCIRWFFFFWLAGGI